MEKKKDTLWLRGGKGWQFSFHDWNKKDLCVISTKSLVELTRKEQKWAEQGRWWGASLNFFFNPKCLFPFQHPAIRGWNCSSFLPMVSTALGGGESQYLDVSLFICGRTIHLPPPLFDILISQTLWICPGGWICVGMKQ